VPWLSELRRRPEADVGGATTTVSGFKYTVVAALSPGVTLATPSTSEGFENAERRNGEIVVVPAGVRYSATHRGACSFFLL